MKKLNKNFKSLTLLVFFVASIFLNQVNVVFAKKVDYYNNFKDEIETQNLLEKKTSGKDTFLGPKYSVLKIDLESKATIDEYNEKIWLMTLWNLAVFMATKNGDIEKIQKDVSYEKLIKTASDVYLVLSKNQELRKNLPFSNQIGSKFRDILVESKAFKGRSATISNAYGRLGGIMIATSLFFEGIDGLNAREKNEILVKTIPVWFYLEDQIIPMVKKTQIYKDNTVLKKAVSNYLSAGEISRNTQNAISEQKMATSAGCLLVSLALTSYWAGVGAGIGTAVPIVGNAVGALIGVAFGLALGVASFEFNENRNFILYNDIFSRQITLAMDEKNKENKGKLFRSMVMYASLEHYENLVSGKGLSQATNLLVSFSLKNKNIWQTNKIIFETNPFSKIAGSIIEAAKKLKIKDIQYKESQTADEFLKKNGIKINIEENRWNDLIQDKFIPVQDKFYKELKFKFN